MEKSNTLNILKNPFLMERQGKSLYETVKLFFDDRATEEVQHMKMLRGEGNIPVFDILGLFNRGQHEHQRRPQGQIRR
ncbi:MAG: hypothetical protein AB1Z38_07910 [Desulfotignum sp.]